MCWLVFFDIMIVCFIATILHKNCESAPPSPSVSVGCCDHGVTACEFPLKTLLRIITLTVGGS